VTISLTEAGHLPVCNTFTQAEWQLGCHSHVRYGNTRNKTSSSHHCKRSG